MDEINGTKFTFYMLLILVGIYGIFFYWKRPRIKINKIDWARRTADVELTGHNCHVSDGFDFRQNGFQLSQYTDEANRQVYAVFDNKGRQICHKTIDYANRTINSGSNFDIETVLSIAQC